MEMMRSIRINGALGTLKNKQRKTADTPHYENVPFEVPSSWEWTTLGELFSLQAGKNITAKEISDKEDSEHRFPCYGGNGLRGYVCTYNRDGRFPLIGRQGALCGNINFADGLFYATEHAVVVETYCETDVEWALHTLTYLNLNQYATSTAQPGLSVSTINEVAIPLPPIKEQRRIVSCLNKWFALINKTEQGKIDLQTTIKQAKSKILDLAIHGKLVPQDPNDEPASELIKRINPKAEITCDNGQYGKVLFELPCNWSWSTLCEITEFIRNGAQIKQVKGAAGIPITRIETISNSELDLTRMGYSDIFNENEYSNYFLQEGDILMSHINSRIHVGKCALCRNMPYKIIHGMNLLRICLKKDILPEYIILFFRTNIFYTQIEPYIKNAVNQASINITNLQKTLMPIPPLPEQKRIVDAVNKAFAKLDTIMESL